MKNYKGYWQKHTHKCTHTELDQMEQASESASDMAEILEWSDLGFKTPMLTILRALMEEMDNMQEEMGINNVQGF